MEVLENVNISGKELSEKMRNTPLEEVSDHIGYQREIPNLKNIGINTFGDLISASTGKIYEATKTDLFSHYSWIRQVVIEKGFLFDDERIYFGRQGISYDLAVIPVKDLDLSPTAKSALRRHNIYCLGDLLTLNYDVIIEYRLFTEERIIELKKYIHSLGFSFPNEKELLSEKLTRYREDGKTLVGDAFNLDGNTASILYRNDIFTIKDLINFGPRVFTLVGIGPYRREQLKSAMIQNNILFKDSNDSLDNDSLALVPSEEVVHKLQAENIDIDRRFKERDEYLRRRERLINSKNDLKRREAQLDREIDDLSNKIETINQIEKGKSYGRR